MNKRSLLAILLLSSLLFSCSEKKNQHRIIKLNQDWEFYSAIYNKSFKAKVPGSVHTDLFQNELIPNPYFGTNENNLQWIDTLEWIYIKSFNKPTNLNPDDNIELYFKGLDTYADVYLNDSLLFSANNMFIPLKTKISHSALKNSNELKIILNPIENEENKQYSKLPYELPGEERVVTRKAAHHYGWDWGPKYVTSGIWQDIEMHIWNIAKINKLDYTIEKLDSELAVINMNASIESSRDFTGNIKLNTPQDLQYSIKNISIKKGTHNYSFQIEIKNPQLWWTHNLGKPFLYHFNIQLFDEKQAIDSHTLNIGLKTIELVKEKDNKGESFYFKLNGTPVFMKGANYIPQSSFPGSVSDNEYKKIISDAKSANMNMLRVWGGGIYEKDIFYDLCDEEGILIWQDFMFANAMYPADSSFIKNIQKEAKFQVERLNTHPCIAIWCGNNEMDEAWHNWGWSANYSKTDSAEIWNNYELIFHHILPSIVNEENQETPYTSSSPLFGRGNPRSSFEGDNHYWYVWHDAYDFDWYNKVTGRFMSEFGFQSFPGIETIEYFDTSLNKNIDSEIILAHQKHHKGNFLINHYMQDYYPVPNKFEDFIYVSQLLQAEGIRTGILAQRRAKPFCMGSLYWQLNDCWPAISWSSIDYLGNWKALHYFAKQDFKNVILSPYLHHDTLDIFAVSDTLTNLNLNIEISLIDFNGKIINSENTPFTLTKNSSNQINKIILSDFIESNSPDQCFAIIHLKNNDQVMDSRTFYFTQPKNLKLSVFELDTQFKKVEEGYEIILNSKRLIKNLYIHMPQNGFLNNNYFDLIPGEEKKVFFKTKEKIDDIENMIEFNSLNHIISQSKN